ncbi:MAG: ABC transporter transmembrane domain-containing protein [Gammaproteobacteria bacterium]
MSDPVPSRTRRLRALAGLRPFLLPYRWTIAAALVALVAAAAATLGMPVAIRHCIDAGIGQPGQADVGGTFIALFGLALLVAGFAALRFYLVSWIGERVVADLRQAVFRHVLGLSAAFYEVTRSGELLSRLTTDTTLIQNVVGSSVSIALRSGITLLGALLMLTVTSPRLTALIVVLIPLVVLPIVLFGRRVRGLSRDSQDRIADTSALAGEVLNAMPVVQAFNLEALHADRFDVAVEQAFVTARRRVRQRALLTAWAIATVFGGLTLVLWMGARAVQTGDMSGGELGQFLLYALFAGGSTAGLSEIWGSLQQAAGASERLLELLATRPDREPPVRAHTLPDRLRGALRFDAVGFAYPTRPVPPALDGFSLDVAAGETVALVGPSGAGKSTLFALLLGFWQGQRGRILLDGIDLADVLPADARAHMAVVPQDTVLFADTIAENIRYGAPRADDAQVRAAAVAAGADDFIRALPQGYDTVLGERGARLSGGQRQRIAIARAVLRAPAVLLLDEATSALDAQAEAAVQEALTGLMRDRTTLVIAHRLATVRSADRIVVMDAGRVVASGTHDQLMASDGLYRRLASLQFRSEATLADLPA